MRGAGVFDELERAPWTLWAWAPITVLAATRVAILLGRHGSWGVIGLVVVIVPLICFFVFLGNRFVWWFVIVACAALIVVALASHGLPRGIIYSLATFGLLLAPPTRRHVFPPRFAAEPGGPWDPAVHDDSTRPRGWYFDPENRTRMRYWDAAMGGWQSKTTRPPRRIPVPPQAVAGPRPVQTSWDPRAEDDASRPPGWYFDPDDPSRMRYWDAALGGWQDATTRAPRRR